MNIGTTTPTTSTTSPGTQASTASLALPTVPSSKYRILTELGRGGMATAYLAWLHGPAGFSKLVVIKRLHPNHALEPEFLRMFLDEARLAARIDHPNVVHTSEVATDGENHFIAMEYIEGQTFELTLRTARAAKDAKEAFPLRLQLHVIQQVLAGLHFAHELRDFDGRPLDLVHRDMSPHNVMITYEGHVKIVDFGIAKAASSSSDTSTGMVKGKAQYMPIEQFEGKSIDRRADVFAIGVMLWQALTGRKLWKDLSDAEIYRALLAGEVPPPRSVVPDVHPELEGICMRALAIRKEDRYATAADLQAALEDVVARHADMAATPRELGAFVAGLFADARAKLRSKIEEQRGRPVDETPVSKRVASTEVAPNKTRRRAGIALGIVAAACAIGAVIARVNQPRAGDASASRSQRSIVTISVEPPGARVSLDGVRLEGTPPTGNFARDRETHVLEVAADGFEPRRDSIVLDSSEVQVDVKLVPAAAAPAVTAPPSPIAATPAPRPHAMYRPRPSPKPAAAAVAPAPLTQPAEPIAEPAETKPTPTRRTRVIDTVNHYKEQ